MLTHRFLTALLFSSAVEAIVVVLICYISKKELRIALIAILGTVCTLPYVWFVFPELLWFWSHRVLIAGEMFAFIFEALLYRYLGRLTWGNALLISFGANAVSFLAWRLT
jgi:hypothetical protein